MNAHIIENGIVVNTIEVESLDFMPNLIDGSNGGIGWKYENGELIEPPKPVVPIQTPQTLTPRQFRPQLLALGLLDEVEEMAATDKATQIWFEYSLDFQRNHEMLIASATALGLGDEDMGTFFIEASKL